VAVLLEARSLDEAVARPDADAPWLAIPTDAELAAAGERGGASLNHSVVYTLHFIPPYTPYVDAPRYKCAAHYTGWADNLQRRLAEHAAGQGARLTQVQVEAGGSWRLAAAEPGTRFRERQLKARGAARRCPICKAEAKIEAAAKPGAEPEAAARPRPEPEPDQELTGRERGAVVLSRKQAGVIAEKTLTRDGSAKPRRRRRSGPGWPRTSRHRKPNPPPNQNLTPSWRFSRPARRGSL
jgi:predicted GIY-YIG superfamily endonuclease